MYIIIRKIKNELVLMFLIMKKNVISICINNQVQNTLLSVTTVPIKFLIKFI